MEKLNWSNKKIELPCLYKKTKSNKIQTWCIKLELNNNIKMAPIKVDPKMIDNLDLDSKYFTEITTTYGQKDGKMQTTTVDITEGKNIGKANETNVLKQGILEMISKWTKQQDRLNYTLTEEQSHDLVIRPMLLHEYKKHSKYIDFKDAYVQEKMDGLRVMIYIDDKGDVVLMSRQGGEFCNMNHIREEIKTFLPKGIYLDGELFSRDLNFNEIVSICKKKDKNDPEKEKNIKFYIFDLLNLNDHNMSFTDRFKHMNKLIGNKRKNIVIVRTDKVKNDEDVQHIYNQYVDNGSEGAVIRDGKAGYMIGKRSHYVLKLKPDDDAEFKIVGFKEGRGKDKGAVIFEMETDDGGRFDARPAMTYEERVKMFKNGKKYIGKQGTVKYMGLTPDGIPRFPVFKAVRD